MSESESCGWTETVQGKKRKRRFSDEQIRSLESMFESQGKLDQKKKQQLAGELGLDPRQVAIWFQNRRARCKSKNLEGDYAALKADYDALLCNFESLKKEKQALAKQLQMLTELERRKDGASSNGGGKDDFRTAACSDDNINVFNNFSEEEADMYMGGIAGDVSASVSTSAELELGPEPSWPSDQPFNNSQWWEFWPLNE